jgi:hypothetical protein
VIGIEGRVMEYVCVVRRHRHMAEQWSRQVGRYLATYLRDAVVSLEKVHSKRRLVDADIE